MSRVGPFLHAYESERRRAALCEKGRELKRKRTRERTKRVLARGRETRRRGERRDAQSTGVVRTCTIHQGVTIRRRSKSPPPTTTTTITRTTTVSSRPCPRKIDPTARRGLERNRCSRTGPTDVN